MQAGDPFGPLGQWFCTKLWRGAGHGACMAAWMMEKLGVHKQYANRLIEPFAHITVVVTATEYANFFALRNHPAAQPEIQALAECMWDLWLHHWPRELNWGEWHLPFVDYWGMLEAICNDPGHMPHPLIRKSVACCARTSYLNHGKEETTQAENDALHDRLVAENPKHASPAEHQATPMQAAKVDAWGESKSTDRDFSGNLRGWTQYRKQLHEENITTYAEEPDYLKPHNPFAPRDSLLMEPTRSRS